MLTARVEEMQRALDQATQQMAELSTKLAAAQTQAPPPNPQIEMRLNGIEQKLNQVAQAPAAQPAAVMQEAPSAPRPAVHKTMHVSAPAPVRHKAAPPPEEIEEANVWVLRAATPDQAWVAKDASTPDLKPVHVGDTLPGIGRVVAIEETTSGWVFQGTPLQCDN